MSVEASQAVALIAGVASPHPTVLYLNTD